jgi:two-component system invasion response regulator UvrY
LIKNPTIPKIQAIHSLTGCLQRGVTEAAPQHREMKKKEGQPPACGAIFRGERPMIKILVADDHAIVRRGVVQILAEIPEAAIDEAASAREVLQAVRYHNYDALVLDIAMPDSLGLETLQQVHRLKPDMPVLMLSISPEKQYAIRALKAGAAGYLTKASAPDELVAAVRQVVQGGKYITRSLAEKLAIHMDDTSQRSPHETLSDREYEVMRLLSAGKTVTEIATALTLNVKTVSTYRSRILEKLDLKNTAEIIRYALERGLV